MVDRKQFFITGFYAWLIFITIDFIFHASIFASFWERGYDALKPLTDLALLIPAGYGSFLVLTLFSGWVYSRFYNEYPGIRTVSVFALLFSGLFSLSNFLGMLSYIQLPLHGIFMINVVYFIEIFSVVLVYSYFQTPGKRSKKIRNIIAIFILGILSGIVIQNLGA